MKNHIINGVRRWMKYLNSYDVSPIRSTRRLTLWWDDSLEVKVVSSNRNLIHTEMRLVRDEAWFHASWIYGTPYKAENQEFWQWLTDEFLMTDASWIYVGVLNAILSEVEKVGGSQWPRPAPPFMQSFMTYIELLDLGLSGPKYTWKGTRNGNLMQERLDRGMVNWGGSLDGQIPQSFMTMPGRRIIACL
ncbi:hypothetical protein ACFXTI_044089 [Malus domestica]